MIKFSKLNFKLSVLALGLFAFASCEKDTGDVGLNTLPSDDGFYVFQDSIKLTGFTTLIDNRPYTYDSTSRMLGSVVDKIDETTYDTIIAECDVPLFFPQSPGVFRNISNAKSLSLIFRDNGYKYGDTLKPILIDVWAVLKDKEELVASFDYSYSANSGYRKNDTITVPLNYEFLTYLVDGIKKTLVNIPVDTVKGYYPSDSNLYAKQDFFKNCFKGIKIRVRNPSDAFIAQIIYPYLCIEYLAKGYKTTEEFLLQRNYLEYVNDTAIVKGRIPEQNKFVDPGSIFSHSSQKKPPYSSGKPGILVQGGAGYFTEIDMSPIASWKDSSNMLVNKATIQFIAENVDGKAPLSSMTLTMINKVDKKNTITTGEQAYNKELGSYTFEINKMLNTYIKNGIPLENYTFYLACPAPNSTVNKTRLKYKDGVNLKVIYSKY